MANYWVEIGGQSYGPADEAMLLQWAREGRVQPATAVREEQTGRTTPAASVGFLSLLFQPPAGALVPGLPTMTLDPDRGIVTLQPR